MLPITFYEGLTQGLNRSEAAKRVYETVLAGLKSGSLKPEQISLGRLGAAMGVINPMAISETFAEMCIDLSRFGFNSMADEKKPERFFQESNPGLLSGAFAVLSTKLLSAKVIEGYNSVGGMVMDELIPTVPSARRFNNVAGVTSLGGGSEVEDGHPYPETDFSTKWVQTFEKKYGNLLSLSELMMQEDQTGLVMRQASQVGAMLRQQREIAMVRGVTDADTTTYRPLGVATALYSSGNQNLIGSSGISGYTSAIALVDWTDVNEVLTCRATKVLDDRIDGTPQPIADLFGPAKLLVPMALDTTARYIKTATKVVTTPGATSGSSMEFSNPVGGRFEVVSSPYLDSLSATTWYYGQFDKQFIWSEVWPLQTFMQAAGSEAAFDRDVGLRVKVRYLGGLSAIDTPYVTKVLGS